MKKEKSDLDADFHTPKQLKKNKKEKADLVPEMYTNFDKDKLHLHEKQKKARTKLLIETSPSCVEMVLKHNKKKKRKRLEHLAETYTDFDDDKLKYRKKEKGELFAEASSGLDKDEIELHKKKKKKKAESQDLSLIEFQSEKNFNHTLCAQPKTNFGQKYNNGKKHKERKKNNINEIDTFAVIEENEIEAAVSKANIFNEVQVNFHNKSVKKCSKNSNISKTFSKPEISSEKQEIEKCRTYIAETNSDCYELEKNSTNYPRNRNKFTEASAAIDQHEVSSRKYKEKLSDTIEASTNINQQNATLNDAGQYMYFSSDVYYNDDPVNFEIPPLHKFETVHRLNEMQKKNLLASGVFIKTGKFTADEDKIIQQNFEDFVKEFGVSDPFSLFGIGRRKKDTELLKFLRAKHFYLRLAKDLNDRSLHNVYKRARVLLHPLRNSGKLTEKEIAHMRKLRGNLAYEWQEIGDTLGSTAERCIETYKWHEKEIAKGHFTKEEKTQLTEALKKVSGRSDLSCKNMKGISWETVASYVPSRNSSQCRMYWANNLAWAPGSAKKEWSNQCSHKLVHILKNLNVENSSMIDWYKVYESFEDFAPSSLYVQKRWLYLKSSIPDYKNKSYKDILRELCNKYSLESYINC